MPDLFIHELYRLTRKLTRQYNERFLVAGVTAQQYFVLHALAHTTMTASTLADRCGLDPATITNLVTNLEKKRLVKRMIDIHDRRSITIELTPTGRQLTAKLTSIATDYHQLLKNKLGEKVMQELFNSFGLLSK